MIKMIWCEDIDHGIGIDNELPWSIKEEMKHFKNTTMEQIVVCGDKTFVSWGNKPLPHRQNIVVSLDKNFTAPEGVQVFNDFKKVITTFKDKDIYIVGGRTIYTLFYPYADELIISTLKKSYNCNIFMHFDLSGFKRFQQIDHDEFIINYYKRVKNDK